MNLMEIIGWVVTGGLIIFLLPKTFSFIYRVYLMKFIIGPCWKREHENYLKGIDPANGTGDTTKKNSEGTLRPDQSRDG